MITATTQNAVKAAPDFSDVEDTFLLALYGRASESQSEDPILVDKTAQRITRQIDPLIAGSSEPLLNMLYERRVDPRLVVHLALRAQKYDAYARDFIIRFPGGALVNLGCGMDTRFQRIDDGLLMPFDLGLPEVIHCKKNILQETDRYRMIASSMFNEIREAQLDHMFFKAFINAPDKIRSDQQLCYASYYQTSARRLKDGLNLSPFKGRH